MRNRGPRALAGEAPAVEPSPELVDELTKRGVTLSTARELAGTFPEERIREKLASFDWLRGESDGRCCEARPGSSCSPSARITTHRKASSSEWRRPGRTAAERKKARQLEEDRERREAAEEERERLRLERVRAYWNSLAEDEKDSLWSKAIDAANPFYLKQYREHEGKGNESEKRWKELLLYPILTIELDGVEAIS